MSDFQKLKDERDALRRAVTDLYGMLLEIDQHPAPVESYIGDETAQEAARIALGDLWPASIFPDADDQGYDDDGVEQIRAWSLGGAPR